MSLKLYNTLTRAVEEFTSSGPEVKYYTCGPTPYNRVHIGNLRAFMFYDLLRRTLEWRGFRVKHVMNITDVDDKTIRDSQKQGRTLREFTEHYTKIFLEDMDALGIHRPTVMPRATDAIEQQVRLVERLLEKGVAYRSNDGIYFRIAAFKDYGKLGHLDIEGLKAGAGGRVAADEYGKENPQDFALWKNWVAEDGPVFWETRLGKGRPGWHLECSALAIDHLGETIDAHAGGVDLIFPHHENEIAQSEAATGKTFSRFWLHNEHLMVAGAKMSKSLNNFYTLEDLRTLAGAKPREVRFALIKVHYRQKLNFQVTYDPVTKKPTRFDAIDDARGSLERIDNFRRTLKARVGRPASSSAKESLAKAKKAFVDALENDLNVSDALASVFTLVADLNKEDFDAAFAGEVEAALVDMDKVLGVLAEPAQDLASEDMALIREREAVRKRAAEAKARGDKPAMKAEFARSDALRDQLKARGIELDDKPDGTTLWKRK